MTATPPWTTVARPGANGKGDRVRVQRIGLLHGGRVAQSLHGGVAAALVDLPHA